MNLRIRADNLSQSPYQELIQSLTSRWVRAELTSQGATPPDYASVIETLLLTTQSPERTAVIVEAVLAQACQLNKPSAWVEQELKFEGMLEGADRADFLRFELQQSETMNDALLDQYNERMKRFEA